MWRRLVVMLLTALMLTACARPVVEIGNGDPVRHFFYLLRIRCTF